MLELADKNFKAAIIVTLKIIKGKNKNYEKEPNGNSRTEKYNI